MVTVATVGNLGYLHILMPWLPDTLNAIYIKVYLIV